MQVKIFQANWISEVENEMNKWLSENTKCKIVDIKTHSATMYDYYGGQQPSVTSGKNIRGQ